MRMLLSVILFLGAGWIGSIADLDQYSITQNKPVQVGTSVTFTITAPAGAEVPYVAWDFGDGNGLGRYKSGWSTSYTFREPGVYQVYARIQGEEFPLTVIQTVYKPTQKPAPTHSSTIVIDTLRQKVWSVNTDNKSVAYIDAVNNELLAEIPAGNHPRTLALDKEGNAWVANEEDASISILAGTGQLLKTIQLPFASRPYGICFDPLKDFCYVTLQGTGKLVKLDADERKILQTTDVGRSPRGIAITSDGKKILVTQFISPQDKGLVRQVDAETMIVQEEMVLAFDETPDFEDRGRGVPNFLSSITITPDGAEAWVPSKKDNTARGLFRDGLALEFDNTVRTIVSRIDLASSTEASPMRIDVNDADIACAVEFSPYGNIAFVALQGNNKIAMIDVASNARLGILDSTGLAPQGLVFNSDGSKLFVHNFLSRTVRVYNTENIVLSNNFTKVMDATIPTIVQEALDPQVLKGKQIFYNAADERMTFAGYISCASCHLDGGSDERVWDFTDRGEGFRNTHSLLGRRGKGMGNVHWTSNFDEIQDFENDMRTGFKGKGFLPDSVFNKVRDPLGNPKAGLSTDLDALAAYVTSLSKVHASPYRNPDGSLTADGTAGKVIFQELACASCHGGTDFTDRKTGAMHDVGTIQASSGKRRGGVLPGFGTPTLKGIWETAPYLHDGSAATLRDVLVIKNIDKKHGDLSKLTETELNQLIAYLLQIDESQDEGTTSLLYPFERRTGALRIIPNPASESVKVQLTNIFQPTGTIRIYHATFGALLRTIPVNGMNEVYLDIDHLSSGVYIVEYSDANSKWSEKMIVK
jgi:DNA-binding beta-propeller fold protein YncE